MSQPLKPLPNNIKRLIIEEALTWLGTPWQHEARVKGVGVDCAQLLIAVYSKAGLIKDFTPVHYSNDWHLHKEENIFLHGVLEYASPVDKPDMGDIAMFRYGRQAAHGAIVLNPEYPSVIHSYMQERFVTITNLKTSPINHRLAGFFRIKGIN